MLTTFNNIKLEGIIGAAGAEVIDITKACSRYMEEKKALRLVKSLGFQHVRQTAYPNTTADLCGKAAQTLLKNLNISPCEIDAFIFVTQSPDYLVPANTYIWQTKLGLSQECLMLDICQGCSGFIYGMFYASTLISANLCNRVLLCAGDTSCIVRDMAKMAQPANAALFGDGGCAALICKDENTKNSYYSIQSNGELAHVIIGDKYSAKRFRSLERDANDNPPAPKGTQINGVELSTYAMVNVQNDIRRLIDYAQIDFNDLSYLIMHQANKSLLSALAKTMDLDNNKVPFLAADTGNTSSASIALALSENKDSLTELTVKPALLCGFGVGMSIASVITDMSSTKIYSPVYL